MRPRIPQIRPPDTHLQAADFVPPDRLVDHPLDRHGYAQYDRKIRAAQAAVRKLRSQMPVRLVVLRHDHQPACILIKAMHDPRPHHPADPRQAVRAVMQQRVDQRPAPVPRAGMHDHSRRLVNHQQILVLVNDIERNILGRRDAGHGRRHDDTHMIPRLQLARGGAQNIPVNADLPFLDQRLNARPRKLRGQRRQRLVRTLPGLLFGESKFKNFPAGLFLLGRIVGNQIIHNQLL